MSAFFVFLTRIFRRGCQNWNLYANEFFFTKHRFLKKYILLKSLSVFRRQFSRFEAKKFLAGFQFCIQFVKRKFSREPFAGNKLLLMVFLDFYAFYFFVNLRRILLAVLSELSSTFPQECFLGKPSLWKKGFLNCIPLCGLVGQSISGFLQNVFCTIVRTAFFVSSGSFHEEKILQNLVFLYEEIRWNFLELLSKNFERVVRTALYMPGKIFMRNFLWKKKQLISGH